MPFDVLTLFDVMISFFLTLCLCHNVSIVVMLCCPHWRHKTLLWVFSSFFFCICVILPLYRYFANVNWPYRYITLQKKLVRVQLKRFITVKNACHGLFIDNMCPWLFHWCPEMHAMAKLANLARFCHGLKWDKCGEVFVKFAKLLQMSKTQQSQTCWQIWRFWQNWQIWRIWQNFAKFAKLANLWQNFSNDCDGFRISVKTNGHSKHARIPRSISICS